jgi:integrase
MIRRICQAHTPTKKETFSMDDLLEFCARPDQDYGDIQDTLLAIIALFGLARSTEIIRIERPYFRSFNEKEGTFVIEVMRCMKSTAFKKTRVFIPAMGLFNSARHMKQHLERIPSTGIPTHDAARVWWRWNGARQIFCKQVMGKSNVALLAKKIAKFLDKNPTNYSSHSFRRSGATAMVEGGCTTEQLTIAGGWASESVARSYYADTDRGAMERSAWMSRSASSSSSSSSGSHVPPAVASPQAVNLTITLADVSGRQISASASEAEAPEASEAIRNVHA